MVEPNPGRPLCSIVIPSFNGRKLLEVCLASLDRHLPRGFEVEVIVVDDASTDDTAAWLVDAHPGVQLIRLPTNGGFVAASNAGVAAARGLVIQLLNNDTEVTAGWVEAGLAPFVDPIVGSVAPLVLVRSDPTRVDSAGDSYGFVGWPSKRGHGESTSDWENHPSGAVFGASGSSAFYRAEALDRVGVYDPSFGSYYEDVDLAFRLRWAGYTCVFTPRSRILHEVSASYDHGKPALQRRMSRNLELLYWSNVPTLRLGATVPFHILFVLLQGIWRTIRGRGLPFLLGKLDAIRLAATLPQRRRSRRRFRRSAVSHPHFPMRLNTWSDAKNHWRRPRESFGRVNV